jgi:lysine decarboxylase/arginine decarboxylase
MLKCFEFLPDPAMIPAAAYKELVLGNVESVFLDDMMGRIPAVMVVPYPPGIPIIMPGEMFNKKSKLIIDYLKKVQEFEFVFPGFTSDIHGVEREADENGKELFKIYCLTKK